jgi:hypothetical protein
MNEKNRERKGIRISKRSHAKLKKYCKRRGLVMCKFLESLITEAVGSEMNYKDKYQCEECGQLFDKEEIDFNNDNGILCYECAEYIQREHEVNISHLNAQYEADRGC